MAERHVLGVSGGKDSAALAVYMRDKHPELDIDYFFTDTHSARSCASLIMRASSGLCSEILRAGRNRWSGGASFWRQTAATAET